MTAQTPFGVNSYVNKGTLKYETVDKTVSLLPPGGFMSKVDLSSEYHSVPIDKSCYRFTGLHCQFEGDSAPTNFVDTLFPFSASETPEKCQHCTSAVTRMMAYKG